MARRSTDRTVIRKKVKLATDRLKRSHASLVVIQGLDIGRDFRLRRKGMTLGRAVDADIRIFDDLASREHARIERRWQKGKGNPAFHLIDLGSTNHTFVNSRQIDRVQLKDGDRIQIGSTVLKFVLLDDVEAKFHEEVRHRITYDQLTGLLTKESLYLALEMELKRSKRYGLPLAVLMMDLDSFKSVNDRYGHQTGSRVIAEVGRLIRESIRSADVSGRYGGEEFVSYLAESSAAHAVQVAERIRSAIEHHRFIVDDLSATTTISIGIAMRPDHGEALEHLVAQADKALYEAKRAGRNRVCLRSDEPES
jgi:diguanylate cyclase (GGDEF)-like protein